MKESGLARLPVSLDSPTAAIHDVFRRVPGSYQWTIDAVGWAREIRLPVQINTTITRHNLGMIDDIIALLETLDITLWSVFFLVPTGRGSDIDLISAEEFEQVFAKLYETSQRALFDIKSTEAQHYRRYLLQPEQRHVGWVSMAVRRTVALRNLCSRPSARCRPMELAARHAASTTARVLSSSRISARCIPADSFRSPAGTYGVNRWRTSIATRRSSSPARQQEPGREVRHVRIPRVWWWLACTLVRDDRRSVRRGTVLRLRA